MKLLEMILAGWKGTNGSGAGIRKNQQGFRKGRGTTGGTFASKQLVKKRMGRQDNMALGFVDLEQTFDTVARDMVMAKVRRVGVAEAGAKMVEAVRERTKGRVMVGPGMSDEF